MPTSPAVCPQCAHVHALDPQALPEAMRCEGCGAALEPVAHGAAVILERAKVAPPPEKPEVLTLLARAELERKPDRAYALMGQALEIDPNSFAANRALLYHGKLHEVVSHPGEVSYIKCYLFHLYEEPEKYTPAQRDAKVEELFRDPQLMRTCELSGDSDVFLSEYLDHLAADYLRIFVRGRSTVGRGFFGFARSADTVQRRCEEITTEMEQNVRSDPRLSTREQTLLCNALRHGLAG